MHIPARVVRAASRFRVVICETGILFEGPMKRMILKSGRERSLLLKHPWIFSGAVADVEGDPGNGEAVVVCASSGKALATASWSSSSQIAGRVWSFDPEEMPDGEFFRRRVLAAWRYRERLGMTPDAGMRCIASEADGLPGVVADMYGGWLVLQLLSAGSEYYSGLLIRALEEVIKPEGIYERSDSGVRTMENLELRRGLISGAEPPEEIIICENGLRFAVDVRHGHKTGFYCDQRDSRRMVYEAVCPGMRVLNVFSYTGGFGVAAAAAGAARVVNVDSSAPALKMAGRNFALNGISDGVAENLNGDAFEILRRLRGSEAERFDVVILDPPKLVDSRGALPRGARAYKDLAMQAFRLLKPDGRLFTFSCSGLVSRELFEKITFEAALDAGRQACVVHRLAQAPDHPVLLTCPEGFYLKGLEVMLCG